MICRRHAAWSIATFTDGLLTNFILPFGPLLLLSHLELASQRDANTAAAGVPLGAKEQEGGSSGEVVLHWAVVAKLWSQVILSTGGQCCVYICMLQRAWKFFFNSGSIGGTGRRLNRLAFLSRMPRRRYHSNLDRKLFYSAPRVVPFVTGTDFTAGSMPPFLTLVLFWGGCLASCCREHID